VCTARYMSIDEVDDAVLHHYRKLNLKPEFIQRVRQHLAEALANQDRANSLRRKQVKATLAKLDRKEENLLDLAEAGTLPSSKVRERLQRIKEERQAAQGQLSSVDQELTASAELYEAALDLLENPQELYRQAGANQRRLLNQGPSP
jgi:site-specific DNA recombinase